MVNASSFHSETKYNTSKTENVGAILAWNIRNRKFPLDEEIDKAECYS